MKNLTQYYLELGKLAYSLVLSDADVRADERKELHQFIAKEMNKLERDKITQVMHNAYVLELDFVKIDQKKADPLHALITYKNFLGKNFEENDERLLQTGMHFLENIGDEYIKQKEQAILTSFHVELKKTGQKIEN
ncbi:MAG: hypothetical protein WCR21_06255 [Bacteroidota bacterium]